MNHDTVEFLSPSCRPAGPPALHAAAARQPSDRGAAVTAPATSGLRVLVHDWALAGTERQRRGDASAPLVSSGIACEESRSRIDAHALAGCDVLVLASGACGGAGRALGGAEVHSIVRWIHAGGGLLLVPGKRPHDAGVTQLAQRLGVLFGDPWWPAIERRQIVFSRDGGQLGSHPTLHGVERLVAPAGVPLLAAPGSATLLHLGGRSGQGDPHRRWLSTSGYAQAVALRAFAGRAAVLGSAAALAAPQPAADQAARAADNARFARNLVYWLAG
jgi:hypothetical protein